MFKVVVHKRAASYLKRLPRHQKELLKKVFQELAHNPFKPGVKAMMGEWKGYYRLRVGDLRVIFWLDNEEQTIYIDYVGPRGDVYKS